MQQYGHAKAKTLVFFQVNIEMLKFILTKKILFGKVQTEGMG